MTFFKSTHILLSKAADYGSVLPRLYMGDRKGVAAIEFALIAPVMIGFYFGLSEISMGITADRQVTHAASVAGDLATQVTSLDKAGIEDVFTATVAVMGVNSTKLANVTIELNSYKMEADGTIETIGYARMGPQISSGSATFDPSTLGDNMLNSTSGVVVARVNYKYKPPTLAFMSNVTLAETFLLKPRKSLAVAFDEGGSKNFSCAAGNDYKVTCTGS